jgi:hypothetical protein
MLLLLQILCITLPPIVLYNVSCKAKWPNNGQIDFTTLHSGTFDVTVITTPSSQVHHSFVVSYTIRGILNEVLYWHFMCD